MVSRALSAPPRRKEVGAVAGTAAEAGEDKLWPLVELDPVKAMLASLEKADDALCAFVDGCEEVVGEGCDEVEGSITTARRACPACRVGQKARSQAVRQAKEAVSEGERVWWKRTHSFASCPSSSHATTLVRFGRLLDIAQIVRTPRCDCLRRPRSFVAAAAPPPELR